MKRADFDKIYEDYYELVLHVAFDGLQDYRMAEEVCLEVFVEFYEKMKHLDKRRIKGWLLGCAREKVIEFRQESCWRKEMAVSGEKIGQGLIAGCRMES